MAALTDDQIRAELETRGAIRSGHFVLTSGRHSDRYVQCARVLEDPRLTLRLAETAVRRLPKGTRVDLVAAPAVGAVLFGFAVALSLGVNFIFTEREDGTMVFRRSFEVPEGASVLVVEDVVTTGGSVREVIDLVESASGTVAGVVSLIDRGGAKAFEVPFWPLLQLKVESWDASACGLCAANVPLYSPGSRRLTR